MPLTPRPLAPLALRLVEIPGIPRVRGVQAVGLARLPTLIRGGASPLRRAAEQHPAQHRDLLRQLRDPGIGLRERLLGPLGTLTPVRHISGVTGPRREGHVLQNTPSPSNTPRTAPAASIVALRSWLLNLSHANGRLCCAATCFVVLITSAYILRLSYHSPWSPPQSLKVSKSVSGVIRVYSKRLPMVSSVGKRTRGGRLVRVPDRSPPPRRQGTRLQLRPPRLPPPPRPPPLRSR